jgi:hypothetical protein
MPPQVSPNGLQTFILRLDAALARRVASFIKGPGHGYDSLNEFVEVALLNQLGAEAPRAAAPAASMPRTDELLQRPSVTPLDLLEPSGASQSLFVLTNRLSPMKIAVRVLANLALVGRWPAPNEFHASASAAAREVGLRLRGEDERREVNMTKRSVGYPVGNDVAAARDRFIFSFTAFLKDGRCAGPLSDLGFVNCTEEGGLGLTRAGWDLATAVSPLLDEDGDGTLSAIEAEVFRHQFPKATQEFRLIAEFLAAVTNAAGQQGRLDQLLAHHHPDWSRDLTVAHRSAMLGRLSEIEVLRVVGRGPKASISLLPHADEFRNPEAKEGA